MLERHAGADGQPHRTDRRAQAGGAGIRGPERANGSSRSDASLVPPESGTKHLFYCQACNHEADLVVGAIRNQIGSFSARCPRGNACLNLIAAELDCRPKDLLDPRTGLGVLRPWVYAAGGAGSRPVQPPSLATVEGWHSALLSSGDPLRYLTERRRLTLDTLRAFKVGWDHDRGDLTFPAFERGRVVYLYRRKPVDRAHMIAMGGERPPYPDLPPDGPLCLVAGELDALTGRQIGLRAVTVSGCSLPDHAVPRFAGRVVYVMFDVGEELAADNVADKLRRAGGTAQVVRLSVLRLPPKFDLNDLYRRCGEHTAQIVKNVIRAQRGRRAA